MLKSPFRHAHTPEGRKTPSGRLGYGDIPCKTPDVSHQTINAIETGKFDPSLPLAFRIAQQFMLSIEEVFEPEEKDFQ